MYVSAARSKRNVTDVCGKNGDKSRKKCGYNDILTFELTTGSKPGRHENDKYAKMGTDEYLAEAYARACRVAVLKQRDAAK